MNIILMGVQGSGKGTQAEKLALDPGWRHINIGQLFRGLLKEDNELSRTVSSYVHRGELVPDEITFEVIDSAIDNDVRGLIFDGFPRTKQQAEYLFKRMDIDATVLLDLPEEESFRRITSRRHCERCHANYNLLFKPPKEEGICDICGGKLVMREDDSLPEIKRRIEIYNQQSGMILKECENYNIPVIHINANQGIDEIFSEIAESVEKLRKNR